MDVLRSTMELKDDTVIIVLGASGDLAKKKTVSDDPPPDSCRPHRKLTSYSSRHFSALYVHLQIQLQFDSHQYGY